MTHATDSRPAPTPATEHKDPWPALFALCLGFFMILVDSTIVSVATPAIIEDLRTDVNNVVWVTSAYLLAYAVPVLITGRLGDRFGPKRLYLAGLTVFTLASLWCGLTGTIEGLIVARVVQGLGASMITPQTMAIITRIFPAARRGAAMALWGATAGVATLVGPILGGVLVDGLGWEWIFFVNVPVGLLALRAGLAAGADADRPTTTASTGWASRSAGSGCSCWSSASRRATSSRGTPRSGLSIGSGLVVLALFLLWQARNKREPLVPLGLFEDRNFSLANVAITAMGFAITAMAIPIMIWAQVVRGWSPTRVGAAAGADGADDDRAGPPRRRAHRPRAPAPAHQLRLHRDHRLAGVAVVADDAGHRGRGRSCCRWCCSASATPSSGRRTARPRPATCRSSRPAPARASTTPPARSARCWARRRSRC